MPIQAVGPRFGLITRIVANKSDRVVNELDRLDESPKVRLSTIGEEPDGRPYALTATGPHMNQVLKELKFEPKDFDLKSESLQRTVIERLTQAFSRKRDPRTEAVWALRDALNSVWAQSTDGKITDLTDGKHYIPEERMVPVADGALYEETGSGILRD